LARFHRGELSEAEGQQVMDAAASQAIREQRDLGLTEWTGGEYYTDDWLGQLPKVLTGIELVKPPEPVLIDYDDHARYRIVGPICAPNGLGYARRYLRERDLEGGVTKVPVPSPVDMTFHEAGQPEELQRQMPALIGLVNSELRAIADAGCPTVQLDAPSIPGLVARGLLTPDKAVTLIAKCLEGVHTRKGVHFCHGTLAGKPAAPTLGLGAWMPLLERLAGVVDFVHLECCYFAQWLERECLRALPRGIDLAAGILSESSYRVEPVAKLESRAADFARVVGEERLWLAPSCGFGRHPVRNVPVLHQKMENLAEAALAL
jgi:5-methyltetrahydropteroyltriglutamate--homocysteine methyltransferase